MRIRHCRDSFAMKTFKTMRLDTIGVARQGLGYDCGFSLMLALPLASVQGRPHIADGDLSGLADCNSRALLWLHGRARQSWRGAWAIAGG